MVSSLSNRLKVSTLYSGFYGDNGYPFANFAERVVRADGPEDIQDKDSMLILWGGTDINPKLYGHEESKYTYAGAPRRDLVEWKLLHKAVALGIPIIGICRGAQMLCAAAGGFLLQDVPNHAGYGHMVTTKDNTEFYTNTIHHQMMCGLEKTDHELVAWTTPKDPNKHYTYQKDQRYILPEGFVEPEFVFFKKIKGYAIQWHPEAMDLDSPATKYIHEYLEKTYDKG